MAITVSDLLTTGGGALPPAIFFGLDDEAIDRKLDAYLTAGYARATDEGIDDTSADADAVARAWAYHAAFDEIVLSMGPAQVALEGEESWTWSREQIAAFTERAAYWLAQVEELIAVAIGEDEPDQGWATITSLRH